jgi:hypothetical protein
MLSHDFLGVFPVKYRQCSLLSGPGLGQIVEESGRGGHDLMSDAEEEEGDQSLTDIQGEEEELIEMLRVLLPASL